MAVSRSDLTAFKEAARHDCFSNNPPRCVTVWVLEPVETNLLLPKSHKTKSRIILTEIDGCD